MYDHFNADLKYLGQASLLKRGFAFSIITVLPFRFNGQKIAKLLCIIYHFFPHTTTIYIIFLTIITKKTPLQNHSFCKDAFFQK